MENYQDELKGSDFKELEKIVSSEEFRKFKFGLRKMKIQDYDRKFTDLSKIITAVKHRKDELLENILLEEDINSIYLDILQA